MSTLDRNSISSKQMTGDSLLEAVIGEDYVALYLPKVYINIVAYLIKGWGIEEYRRQNESTRKIIEKVCQFNSKYECDNVEETDFRAAAYNIIEYTLDILGLLRSKTNYKECAVAFFSSYQII